jgi:hypothetical protein
MLPLARPLCVRPATLRPGNVEPLLPPTLIRVDISEMQRSPALVATDAKLIDEQACCCCAVVVAVVVGLLFVLKRAQPIRDSRRQRRRPPLDDRYDPKQTDDMSQ